MQQHDNLIGGEWTKGGSYSPNLNPSNLGDTIAEYAQGDASHVEAAVAAATAAFPAWATVLIVVVVVIVLALIVLLVVRRRRVTSDDRE